MAERKAKTTSSTRRVTPPAASATRELVRLVDERDHARNQLEARGAELAATRRQLRAGRGPLMVAMVYLAIALILVAVVYGKRTQR